MSDEESDRKRIAEAMEERKNRREKDRQAETEANTSKREKAEREAERQRKLETDWELGVVLYIKGALHTANEDAGEAILGCSEGDDGFDPDGSRHKITVSEVGIAPKRRGERQIGPRLVFELKLPDGKVHINSPTQGIGEAHAIEHVDRNMVREFVVNFMVHVLKRVS